MGKPTPWADKGNLQWLVRWWSNDWWETVQLTAEMKVTTTRVFKDGSCSLLRFRGSCGGRHHIPVCISAWRDTFNYSSSRTCADERKRVPFSVQLTNCASLPRITPMCLVLNICSLVKNFAWEELQSELMCNSIVLCCLSETWLRSDIDNSLVTPDGYLMLRKDRATKRGGGVAILCRKDWKIEETDIRGNKYECLWAKVFTTNHRMRG